MVEYLKKAMHSIGIVLVSSLLTVGFSYLTRIILARELSNTEYGLFYAVFAFISLLGLINNFGLQDALVKFLPEYIHHKEYLKIKQALKSAFMMVLGVSVIIAGIIFLCSNYLAEHYFGNPDDTYYLVYNGKEYSCIKDIS